MMFYNVENLFPPDVKPLHKRNPTFSGLRNWDQRKYENKIFKLSKVMQLVEEQYFTKPFILGLSEIHGKQVLEDLLKQEYFNGYKFIHFESMDERGVDVALLYDAQKMTNISAEPITYFFEIPNEDPEDYDTTRDVLHCRFDYQNFVFNVFVVHLPSKREQDVNLPKRTYILKELGQTVKELIHDKNEAVIVMGDFNSNPDEQIIENLTIDKDFNKILTNPYFEIYKNNVFSTFHNKYGLLFDQMLLSQHFYQPESILRFKNSTVFNSLQISSNDKRFLGRPFRTYAGSRYLGGYSDHFPVITEFFVK